MFRGVDVAIRRDVTSRVLDQTSALVTSYLEYSLALGRLEQERGFVARQESLVPFQAEVVRDKGRVRTSAKPAPPSARPP